MDAFNAYVAGFFDGEGWAVIGRERKEGRSDVYRIGVYLTQRARSREVLDRVQAEFGGLVSVRDTRLRVAATWAEQADWHIHTRDQIERFCLAVQPYCIVKARQIAIMLEFVQGFQVGGIAPGSRDELGRSRGREVSLVELERRGRLRDELKAANMRGPVRTEQIIREPVRHLARPQTPPKSDPATVSRGEGRYNARLNEAKVRDIRERYAAGGVTQEQLGIEHGVSTAAIRQVIRGISWQHVT